MDTLRSETQTFLANFPLGKRLEHRYNIRPCNAILSSPLQIGDTHEKIGIDSYVVPQENIWNHSALLHDMKREIQEGGLRVIHLFNGGFDWNGYFGGFEHVLTNDYCLEHPSQNHDHPVVFLENLKRTHPSGWADVVIYGAPSNQLLLKRYLSVTCGGGDRERDFHTLNKKWGVKQGDAGLASCCKRLLNYFLKPGSGRAITISFKTTGFGISMGFELEAVETIPHPLSWNGSRFGCHDTMITVERKTPVNLSRIINYPILPSHHNPRDIVYRMWSMYCSGGRTFSVPAIRTILEKTLAVVKGSNPLPVIVDPFSRNSDLATVDNDLNPETTARYHMDALDFLRMILRGDCVEIPEGGVDLVLLDPPYSDVQNSICYQNIGGTREGYTINSDLYAECMEIITQILRPGGIVISFGWSSLGGRGLQRLETVLVCHGASHDDTILNIDQKKLDG